MTGRLTAPKVPVGIQTELVPDVGDYLGLEVPEAREGRYALDELRQAFARVRHLTDLAPDAIAFLEGWPGPATLDDAPVLRHAYLKLVLHPGHWETKAYLGATPTNIDAALREASRGVMVGSSGTA